MSLLFGASKANIYQLIADLNNSTPIVFPTDTIYGIGVYYNDKLAIDKIYNYKQRPRDKLLTLNCQDLQQASQYVVINDFVYNNFAKWLPGPLTLVLPIKNEYLRQLFTTEFLGIRIPLNKDYQALLSVLPKPLLATSANWSNKLGSSDYHNVELFANYYGLSLLVTNEMMYNVESTVVKVDSNNQITMLREGYISSNELQMVDNFRL